MDTIPEPVMIEMLQLYGFTIGKRDPRLNTRYPGAFMVVEIADMNDEAEVSSYNLPTEDGRDGPWCVVGDDQSDLIRRAFDYLMSCSDEHNGIEQALDRLLAGTLNR